MVGSSGSLLVVVVEEGTRSGLVSSVVVSTGRPSAVVLV
jgi:hypothetical protein